MEKSTQKDWQAITWSYFQCRLLQQTQPWRLADLRHPEQIYGLQSVGFNTGVALAEAQKPYQCVDGFDVQ